MHEYTTNRSLIYEENGSIFFAPDRWKFGPPTPENIATAMTQKDVETILNACGGDFSRINPDVAKGMALFAALSLEKREERNKKRAEDRVRRAAEFHKAILAEIHELMGDKEFTITELQLAARDNGYPVRTRQMYSYHLSLAIWYDDVRTVERNYHGSDSITVILRNGKTSGQTIPGSQGWNWHFISEKRG